MFQFDAHTHSIVSDGTQSPSELMICAKRAGLSVVALTDHDTVQGWEEATEAAKLLGIGLVRGIEFSTSYKGSSAHLLAYLPEPGNLELVETMSKVRDARQARLRRMVANIGADYPRITWERLTLGQLESERPWGRPHLADALVAEGYLPDRSSAFEQVLSPSGPYFEHQWAPSPVESVQIVRRAGGVPVLAHPLAGGRQRRLPDQVIGDMVEAGLFGLERDHREHGSEERERIDIIAKRWNLAVTGGSDFHGSGKPNRIGENLTAQDVYCRIVEEGSAEVIGL